MKFRKIYDHLRKKIMIFSCFEVNPAADFKSVIFNWRRRHITLPPFISRYLSFCRYGEAGENHDVTMTSDLQSFHEEKNGEFFPRFRMT